MKIITYNVNGLRAAVSKGLPEWLAKEQPDVLCLQETKLQPEQYPAEALDALGYRHYLHSARKKGYSGVAILTKREPDHVEYGMGMEEYDSEGRFVRADYGDLSVVSVYHPSGTSGDERQAFKMEWLEHFRHYAVELLRTRPKLVLCGDYNICHEAIDIHDPVRNATNSGFLPEEREWMTRFLNEGFIDAFRLLHPDSREYTLVELPLQLAGEEQRLAYRLLHGKRGGASDAERGAYPERCGTFGSLPHDVGINRLRYDDERQSGKSR